MGYLFIHSADPDHYGNTFIIPYDPDYERYIVVTTVDPGATIELHKLPERTPIPSHSLSSFQNNTAILLAETTPVRLFVLSSFKWIL